MPKKLRKLRLHELSLVDYPANKHSTVTLFKRDTPVAEIAKQMEAMDFDEIAAERQAMEVAYQISDDVWMKWNDLQTSFGTIACDESMSAEEKIASMKASLKQFIGALEDYPDVSKALLERISESPALAALKVGEPDETEQQEEDNQMTLAELQKAHDKLAADLEAMTKKASDSDTALATITKAHAEAEAKIKDLEKAAEVAKTDESVKIGETVVTKSSVGDAAFAIIKAQQEQVRIEREKVADIGFQKSAETDYGNLPGETVAKGIVLKHVADMPEEARKTLESMLKAGNAAMRTSAMSERGQAGGAPASADSAQGQLDALIAKHAEDHKVSIGEASRVVLNTAEGTRLHSQARVEKRHAH
jgi:hypothetical protein